MRSALGEVAARARALRSPIAASISPRTAALVAAGAAALQAAASKTPSDRIDLPASAASTRSRSPAPELAPIDHRTLHLAHEVEERGERRGDVEVVRQTRAERSRARRSTLRRELVVRSRRAPRRARAGSAKSSMPAQRCARRVERRRR